MLKFWRNVSPWLIFVAQAVVTNRTSLIILVIKLTVLATSLLLLVVTGMFCWILLLMLVIAKAMLTVLELWEKKKKKVPNMDKYDLVDVWPQVFPDKRGYMRRKFSTVQRDRLDCFLISEELMPDVNRVKLNRSHSSDPVSYTHLTLPTTASV